MHALKSTFIIFFLCFLYIQSGYSQDPRFAQINAAPHQLNPAMIGVYEGRFRFTANYRELYNSILNSNPYRTIAASFDMRTQVMRGDYFGFGVSLMKDEVGISGYNRVQGLLGMSFMKQLGGSRYATNDQYLIAGLQLGLGQRGFDPQRLWFTNQFDAASSAVDLNRATGENFTMDKTDPYMDFNAGILWYALADDKTSIYFGGALHHVNTPNISFLEDEDEILHTRWVVHGGGEFPFTEQLSFLPSLAVMGQNQAFSTTTGGNFRYTNRDWREVALRAGAWFHFVNKLEDSFTMDAVILNAVLEVERWQFGISYDITSSSLTEANNARGAFEASLIYVHPYKSRRKALNCPNF